MNTIQKFEKAYDKMPWPVKFNVTCFAWCIGCFLLFTSVIVSPYLTMSIIAIAFFVFLLYGVFYIFKHFKRNWPE